MTTKLRLTAKVREGRLALAKDVLSHLRYLDLRTGNTYCDVDLDALKLHDQPAQSDAQPHINRITKHCTVCALGAMFLSYIRKFDNVTLDQLDWVERGHIVEVLRPYFTKEELDLIEDIFEQHDASVGSTSHERVRDAMRYIVKAEGGDFLQPMQKYYDAMFAQLLTTE